MDALLMEKPGPKGPTDYYYDKQLTVPFIEDPTLATHFLGSLSVAVENGYKTRTFKHPGAQRQ